MSPVAPVIGRLALAFNGSGVWSREQRVWGLRVRSRTFDRALYLWMHRLGLMGRPERAALGRIAKPGMTVLDVGANLGLYSVLLSRLVGPAGKVIAFEPDPGLYALLRENCAANGALNVSAHNLALGSAPERMVLSRLTLNSGDNHLGADAGTTFRRPVEVEVEALDTLMPGLRPDLVKVDVQGWELKVLRGLERMLRTVENVVIFLEVCPKWLRRAGDGPEELHGFLTDMGFRFYSSVDWRELDRAAFVMTTGRLRGQDHVDLLVTRSRLPAR